MAHTLFLGLAFLLFLSVSVAKDCSYTSLVGTYIELDCPGEDCCDVGSTYKYCCTSSSSPPINVGDVVSTLGTIWIVVIVVGCVVFLATVIGIILCCCCCCKKAASSSGGNPGVIYQPQPHGQQNTSFSPSYPQSPTSNAAYPTKTPQTHSPHPANPQSSLRM